MKIITPNTNIGPDSVQTSFLKDNAVTEAKIADGSITAAKIADGTVVAAELASNSVTEAKIADDAVSLAKINTSGASNEQVLTYNSTSGEVEWADNADIDVSNITDKMKITQAASLLSPIQHLKTTNNGWDKAHILLEDSVDDAVTINGRVNTGWHRYQQTLVFDPNNTKPRTNVGGDGQTFAGDYAFDFAKHYGSNQDTISMDLNVYGANDGFNIIARDDANGGVDSYNYKPINLKGSDVTVRIGTTPFGSTTERLAFNDFGMSVSEGALVVGKTRTSSNFQWHYTGSDTDGDPKMLHQMHNIGDNRVMSIMKAFDNGTTSATVTIDNLVIGDDTTAGDSGFGDYENLSITPTGGGDGSATLQSARLTSSGTVSHHSVTGNGIKITPIHNELLGPTTWMTIHSLTYNNYFINGMTGIHPSNGKPIYYYNGWKYFSDDSTAT